MTFRHLVAWIHFLYVPAPLMLAVREKEVGRNTRKCFEGLKQVSIVSCMDCYIQKSGGGGLNIQEVLVSRKLGLNAGTLNSNG